MYLQHLDRYLEGEAAKWVLNTPSVRALIYKGYMESATESDIDAFHRALSDHFKLTDREARDHIATPLQRLVTLRQQTGECLQSYYERARDVLLAIHGRDGESDALTPPEMSLRTLAVWLFARGLSSERLKDALYQQNIRHHTVSLHQAFKMAEAQLKSVEVETRSDERGGKRQEQEEKKKKKSKRIRRDEKRKRKAAGHDEGTDSVKRQK